MEMKIIKQQKNPFLHREEYSLQIKAPKTPSFADVKKELAKDEELTVVKKVEGNFGRDIFNVEAFVYNSKENKNKIEKISRKQRRKLAEDAKAAAGQAPAAPTAPAKK